MAKRISKTKNYAFPAEDLTTTQPEKMRARSAKDLNRYIAPVQLQRMRQDVLSWRDALREAELAYYPHRVKIQRLFMDTALNGHVTACIERRKNLTLLKDYALFDGEEPAEDASKILKKKWFGDLMGYILDAQFYGYSLISLGDVINDEFPDLRIIKRHNVSPDRDNLTAYVYSLSGINFTNPENKDDKGDSFYDWSIWIPTTSELGVSKCGYGLYYKVAIYEIFARNLLGFNGDFVELYAMPYRVGKTTKTTEVERAELENALKNMGSAGYAIIDPQDEISFLETALGGTGWKGYENLETRCEKKISKVLLGHADALDSTPGKLGAESSAEEALEDVEVKDCRFLEYHINSQVIPKLKNIGLIIPDGLEFKFKNDHERAEQRAREDQSNLVTADIAYTLHQAGMKIDPAYIQERTGIPVTEAPAAMPVFNKDINDRVKNRLKEIYK